MPCRWQISRATAAVTGVSGGRLMKRERLAHALIGDNVQERRLFELDGQRLLERAVEHRVAGRVAEVGDQDAVAGGQRLLRPRSCQ